MLTFTFGVLVLVVLGAADKIQEEPEIPATEPLIPIPPARPIFGWKSDNDKEETAQEANATAEELPLSDEVLSDDEKGYQSDDSALRQLYWYAYHYPSHASLVQYYNGYPGVMTLTESQLAWINSLHPELRDQYLKDFYVVRSDSEGVRAQAMIQRYEDAYNYLYHVPYLRRRPVSLVMEDPISTYDYSCNESGHPFVKAPRLRNMQVHRYDRRQNPNNPRNNYLSAVYRCKPGYAMRDTRYTELHCSKKSWIGIRPVCDKI